MEKKDPDNEKRENKEPEENKNNITLFNSVKENWLSWLFFLASVYLISPQNLLFGYVTLFSQMFFYYAVHMYLHYRDNITTILHKYHQYNENSFSYYSGIIFELNYSIIHYIYYHLTGYLYADIWVVMFFALFYSSLHNINYGIFRVNKVHYLHHQMGNTNVGIDVFDVMFGSKHPDETVVENTDHYIPIIIAAAAITLITKYFYETNETVKYWLLTFVPIFFMFTLTFVVVSSVYLYFFNNLPNSVCKGSG
jgi:hypothetical protein